jgi:hypothetical protein
MANPTSMRLHSDRGASLRLLVIAAICAVLGGGFVASAWRGPRQAPDADRSAPAERTEPSRPVALR